MQTQDSKTQFIFLDESGKPEVYSAKGINLVEKGQATKFNGNGMKLLKIKSAGFKIFAIKNTSLGAIRYNYPLKEVRTSHVSLSGLL